MNGSFDEEAILKELQHLKQQQTDVMTRITNMEAELTGNQNQRTPDFIDQILSGQIGDTNLRDGTEESENLSETPKNNEFEKFIKDKCKPIPTKTPDDTIGKYISRGATNYRIQNGYIWCDKEYFKTSLMNAFDRECTNANKRMGFAKYLEEFTRKKPRSQKIKDDLIRYVLNADRIF